jgi:hypothetical protein
MSLECGVGDISSRPGVVRANDRFFLAPGLDGKDAFLEVGIGNHVAMQQEVATRFVDAIATPPRPAN